MSANRAAEIELQSDERAPIPAAMQAGHENQIFDDDLTRPGGTVAARAHGVCKADTR